MREPLDHQNFVFEGIPQVGDKVFDRRHPGRAGKVEEVFRSYSDKKTHVIVLWEGGQREEVTTEQLYSEEPTFWREEGLDPEQDKHVVASSKGQSAQKLVRLTGGLRQDLSFKVAAKLARALGISEEEAMHRLENADLWSVDGSLLWKSGENEYFILLVFEDGNKVELRIKEEAIPDEAKIRVVPRMEANPAPVAIPQPQPIPGISPPSAFPEEDTELL
jgi:hypothetical protein